jgi:hypothetical protein
MYKLIAVYGSAAIALLSAPLSYRQTIETATTMTPSVVTTSASCTFAVCDLAWPFKKCWETEDIDEPTWIYHTYCSSGSCGGADGDDLAMVSTKK